MSRILIIGGTRFTGRAVVEALLAKGNDVTTLSRRPSDIESPENLLTSVVAERKEGIAELRNKEFDWVFDFIAYDGNSVKEAIRAWPAAKYVLISSVWLAHLQEQHDVDQAITLEGLHCPPHLRTGTFNYLYEKVLAENVVLKSRKRGGSASVLRLPIMLGATDHTGRLSFYFDRLNDENSIILINNGENITQIAWYRDVADAIAYWVDAQDAPDIPIWEALPNYQCTLKEFVTLMASVLSREPSFTGLSLEDTRHHLSEYFDAEPFSRELYLKPSASNIFSVLSHAVTPLRGWLDIETALLPKTYKVCSLREQEIEWLNP